jgi:hypothetical protein
LALGPINRQERSRHLSPRNPSKVDYDGLFVQSQLVADIKKGPYLLPQTRPHVLSRSQSHTAATPPHPALQPYPRRSLALRDQAHAGLEISAAQRPGSGWGRGASCKRHTVFCGEYVFVGHQLLHRAHDEVNILGGCALDLLAPLVIPVVLSVGTKTTVRAPVPLLTHPDAGLSLTQQG